MSGRFQRLDEADRPRLTFTVDGAPVAALQGDTLLVAMLTGGTALRDSEFGDGRRAGFCLMGACQDCWVWTAAGDRLRACSTLASDGLAISTHQPEATWPNLG
ncbi:MAG TPA: (2Fe-2S)-binding protein [Novosphingobium sp.]